MHQHYHRQSSHLCSPARPQHDVNTQEGYLTLPNLHSDACKTYLFDDMQSSLISTGQLCDAGCVASTFSKDHVHINKEGELILKGLRDAATGL